MNQNQNKRNLPPFCPACDAEGDIWERREKTVEQVFRKETFRVKAYVTECKKCGFGITRGGDSEGVVHATWNAYRKKHGLLQPREIVSRRQDMGLTQKEFAERLGVGVASIKRWEKGLVQDKSSDNLIRKMTEAEPARRDVDALGEKDSSAASKPSARDFRHTVLKHRITLESYRTLFDTDMVSTGKESTGGYDYIPDFDLEAPLKGFAGKGKEATHEEKNLDLTPAA